MISYGKQKLLRGSFSSLTTVGLAGALLWWISLSPMAAAGPGPAGTEWERFEFRRVQMGTEFRFVFYSGEAGEAPALADSAFDRVEALEAILSDYRSDSELALLSRKAVDGPVVVSAELYGVLEQARQISEWSRGAFDVTVKPLVELWRIARNDRKLPSAESIEEARQRVGWTKVLLNPRLRAVHLTAKGIKLDLGGIAKGLAADEAFRVFLEAGIERVLVDAGGDLRLGLPPPGLPGWDVALESEDGRLSMQLASVAVATSSDRYRFVEIDGIRYSHIVDPRTGLGLRHRGTVTVKAPSALLADGLATALSVMEPEDGLALAGRLHQVDVRIVRVTSEGMKVHQSPHFLP